MDISEVPNVERQTSGSLSIPERRVVVKDPNDLPLDYSTTPGGTIFSTTPGGMILHGVWGEGGVARVPQNGCIDVGALHGGKSPRHFLILWEGGCVHVWGMKSISMWHCALSAVL